MSLVLVEYIAKDQLLCVTVNVCHKLFRQQRNVGCFLALPVCLHPDLDHSTPDVLMLKCISLAPKSRSSFL